MLCEKQPQSPQRLTLSTQSFIEAVVDPDASGETTDSFIESTDNNPGCFALLRFYKSFHVRCSAAGAHHNTV